jgi:hypothetical protein
MPVPFRQPIVVMIEHQPANYRAADTCVSPEPTLRTADKLACSLASEGLHAWRSLRSLA